MLSIFCYTISMIIYVGADHGGFDLKNSISALLKGLGYEVNDSSAPSIVPDDDYPEYASRVAAQVAAAPDQRRGLLFCRSGVGMDIVANKYRSIRSCLGMSPDHVYAARHDDDVNILVLASDYVSRENAEKMVNVFLTTPFAGDERYRRRLNKIFQIENS